jgi:hypothetical protein
VCTGCQPGQADAEIQQVGSADDIFWSDSVPPYLGASVSVNTQKGTAFRGRQVRTLTKSIMLSPAASIFGLSVSLTPLIHSMVSTRREVASHRMAGVRTRGTWEYSSANRSQLCPSCEYGVHKWLEVPVSL